MSATVVLAVEEPTGYRTEQYDDEVPDTLSGAIRVTAIQLHNLQQRTDAIIVDVIPEQRAPEDLPADQLWMPVSHEGVAGALWLPDVGYGTLSEVTDTYFKRHLAEATSGNLDVPLVFYCRSRCWMSWNAAKRALAYGYRSVYWFAEGIDEWKFEGFKTEVLKPAPGRRQDTR